MSHFNSRIFLLSTCLILPGLLLQASLLAPWVGPNILLGDDPVQLPAGIGKNQAEPHAIRSIVDPDLVLATFQEGRFSDGGAYNNGFAVSEDGGFTWNRSLNPRLTIINGGPYFRATDPVGGINREGELFLNSLVAMDDNFNVGRLVVQRSSDRGQTWTDPITVYTGFAAAPNQRIFPDKNWMVVNDYPDTSTTGRIIVTWTDFRVMVEEGVEDIQDYIIRSAYSDDDGESWSPALFVTPPSSPNFSMLQYQGSQPVFLPGGALAIVYHNFLKTKLEVSYSPGGGDEFPFDPQPVHDGYILYDMPNMRDGSFLPSVNAARETGDLYIAYTSMDSPNDAKGHIYFVRSQRTSSTSPQDQDVDWRFRTPVKVSGVPPRLVSTPTISVTPDGQRVTIYYYDNRNGTGVNDSGDFYSVQSTDGGSTWTDPFRLTEQTFELNKATSTSRGFMIGDYFGFAPPLGPDQAGVAVWVDTRGISADPWGARIGGLEGSVFQSWLQANLPYSIHSIGEEAMRYADPEKDGTPNIMEYVLGQSPRLVDPLPGLTNELSHLRINISADPAIAVTVRGGTGRWPAFQQISGLTPVESIHGEGFWNRLTWSSGSQFDHLQFSINSSEDWFLLDESAPVRWVRESADGWVWSPWFGYIYTEAAPWLFHLSLGWVYDFQGVLYSPLLSTYLYPSVGIHPWMYRQDGYHVYLVDGAPWIYDTLSAAWIETY